MKWNAEMQILLRRVVNRLRVVLVVPRDLFIYLIGAIDDAWGHLAGAGGASPRLGLAGGAALTLFVEIRRAAELAYPFLSLSAQPAQTAANRHILASNIVRATH